MLTEDVDKRFKELVDEGIIKSIQSQTDERLKFLLAGGVTKERLVDSQKYFTVYDVIAVRSLVNEKIAAMVVDVDEGDKALSPLPSEVINSYIEELPEDQRPMAAVYAMIGMAVNIAFNTEVQLQQYVNMVEVIRKIMEIPEEKATEVLTLFLLSKVREPVYGGAGVVVNTPLGEVRVDSLEVKMNPEEES